MIFLLLMVEVVMLVLILNVMFLFISMKGDKNEDMLSSYECGFDSVMGSRMSFSYRFFLISILFLVFDVEITLLISLPYIDVSWVQVVGVWWFILVLLVGLIYEYYNGVLSWIKVENF